MDVSPKDQANALFKTNQFNVPSMYIVNELENLCRDVVRCSIIITDSFYEWGSALYNLQVEFVKELRILKNMVEKSPHVDDAELQNLRGIILDINTLRMQALHKAGVYIETRII